MATVKQWMLLPFEPRGKRRTSAYRAEAPDNSPPRSRGGPEDAPGAARPQLSHATTNAFREELERSKTHNDFSRNSEEDIVHDYNAPVHMWVVATLFPLIAGTFGPMASMFNICAIAVDWRILVNPAPGSEEANGSYITDPRWLVAVNAISLVIAIIANLSLLGQMTNRLRYNVSAPITLAGFYISGILDIALVAAAPTQVPLPNHINATWSQAFYYAAFSGAIYVCLALMLTVTAVGIWIGHYSDEFKLSLSQRSLMLQTMMFLGYVLAAGAVYMKLEGWDFLNATYFIIVTLFTIGFGDLVPTTHLARSLFFPMAVGGILYVGVIVANIRALVLESGSVKVSTRMIEKARQKAIKSGDPDSGTVKLRGIKRMEMTGETELIRREKEFNIMRAVQKEAATNSRIFSLTFATLAFCILWFIGGVAFWQAEMSTDGQHWTYFETIYFTFVAQLTIGYGDFEPQTNSAKPTFVFWALIALPTLTVLIGAVGDSISDFVNWYTVFLGKHTKDILRWFKSVRGQDREDPKAAAKRIEQELDDEEKGFIRLADVSTASTIPRGLDLSDLSSQEAKLAEQAYRPLMLLRAANKVVQHLDDSPPKKYDYDEWCWLLKLLGENEDREEGHRRVDLPMPEGMEIGSPVREKENHVWSWLGQESPLMSLEDDCEPKWVLRRLMRKLEHDLKERAERRIHEDLGRQLREKDDRTSAQMEGKDAAEAWGIKTASSGSDEGQGSSDNEKAAMEKEVHNEKEKEKGKARA